MTERDPSDPKRRRLDSVIPELFKRAVELGVEKATEAPDSLKAFVGDMKLPKEIAQTILAQVDETKNGLFRVVAKEIRDFLEHTNLSAEMQKMLTTVQFEINTTIRFTPNDGSAPSEGKGEQANGSAPPPPAEPATQTPLPEVKTQLHVTREPRVRERRRSRE